MKHHRWTVALLGIGCGMSAVAQNTRVPSANRAGSAVASSRSEPSSDRQSSQGKGQTSPSDKLFEEAIARGLDADPKTTAGQAPSTDRLFEEAVSQGLETGQKNGSSPSLPSSDLYEEAIAGGLDADSNTALPDGRSLDQLYKEAIGRGLDPDALAKMTPEERSRFDQLISEAVKTGIEKGSKAPSSRPKPTKVRPIPRYTDYQEYRRVEEEQKKEPRKTVMVRKLRIDPCGTFEVSWGGTKTCHAREIAYHELQYVDDPKSGSNEREQATGRSTGLPSSRPSGFPMPSSPGASSSGPMGGGNPSSNAGGESAGSAGGSNGSNAGSATGSNMSSPTDAAGFSTIGQFAARLDSVRLADAFLDVRVSLRAAPGATRLVGNGDWFANAIDADGVGMESTAIWRAADGKPQPFDVMPHVPGGSSAQVRFMIPLEPGHAGIAGVSIRDLAGNVAMFDLSGRSDLAARTPRAVRAQTTPVTIGDFAVVIDRVASWVDNSAELTFSARNLSRQRRFLGGTRLIFRARRENGEIIEGSGRIYLARGKLGRAVEMTAVEAGTTVQLRVVFDTPAIIGPVNVSDGTSWVTAPLPTANEPAW